MAKTISAVMNDKKMEEIDTNKDEKISKEEWIAKYGNEDRFKMYDLNKDGQVDKEEFYYSAASKLNLNPNPNSKCNSRSNPTWRSSVAARLSWIDSTKSTLTRMAS